MEIQAIVEKLELYKPEKVFLFGSRAWGEPESDSDIDLLIIKDGVDEMSFRERYLEVSRLFRPRQQAMDFLVYSPREVKKRLYLEDPFIKRVLNEGKVIYGS